MRRPARAAMHQAASSFNIVGQDSTTSSGGDVVVRAAATASVVLESGTSASFAAQGTVFNGDIILGTGSNSLVTLGGTRSIVSAVELTLFGQSTTSGHGGDLVLLAGPGAAQTGGGSLIIDAGSNPASSLSAEVQVATDSVSPYSPVSLVFVLDSMLGDLTMSPGNRGMLWLEAKRLP